MSVQTTDGRPIHLSFYYLTYVQILFKTQVFVQLVVGVGILGSLGTYETKMTLTDRNLFVLDDILISLGYNIYAGIREAAGMNISY